jgi:hypothetical protein
MRSKKEEQLRREIIKLVRQRTAQLSESERSELERKIEVLKRSLIRVRKIEELLKEL